MGHLVAGDGLSHHCPVRGGDQAIGGRLVSGGLELDLAGLRQEPDAEIAPQQAVHLRLEGHPLQVLAHGPVHRYGRGASLPSSQASMRGSMFSHCPWWRRPWGDSAGTGRTAGPWHWPRCARPGSAWLVHPRGRHQRPPQPHADVMVQVLARAGFARACRTSSVTNAIVPTLFSHVVALGWLTATRKPGLVSAARAFPPGLRVRA